MTWRVIAGLLVALIVLSLIESQSERAADVYVVILILGFIVANQSSLMQFAADFQAELSK